MTQTRLSEALRAGTRHAHHELDHHPALALLLSDQLNCVSYRQALTALYRPWKPLELAIEESFAHLESTAHDHNSRAWLELSVKNYFPRRYVLESDLESLGELPQMQDDLRFDFGTLPELAGGLYVYFGAQLGGRYIASLVERRDPELPTQFFNHTHSGLNEFWGLFMQRMDQANEFAESEAIVIESAQQTFLKFQNALD